MFSCLGSHARTGIYTSASPDSLACRLKIELYHSTVLCLVLANLQILGLLILHNHTIQFYVIIVSFSFPLSLKINIYINIVYVIYKFYIYIYT